jgi:long-chain acyl-CoA synthetase
MRPRTILLTGTGTVGRDVLFALLRRTTSRVVVLIRDRGRKTAAERAAAMVRALGLTPEECARLDVVRGDVREQHLGLDAATQARLISSLDVIVHTAAVTSLTADRSLCEAVNCGGTAHVLLLAERCFRGGRLQRFMHLSTALVAGAGSTAVVLEDALSSAPLHANHYEWSKHAAERIVRAAMHAGLPVTVFRPSMVVGDSKTGWTRDFNVIYPLVRMLADGYVSNFPADPEAHVHLAPLDMVVDAILRAMDEPWTAGRTFHLTAPAPPTVAQLFACETFFPPGAARPCLRDPDTFDPADYAPRERELLESVAFCFPYFRSGLTFDTTNAARLMELPVTDAAFLERLGRFAIDAGYFRAYASQAGQ